MHEKRDIYGDLVCRGDAVQQSQWTIPVDIVQYLSKLRCLCV